MATMKTTETVVAEVKAADALLKLKKEEWCYVCREEGHSTKGCRVWHRDMKENIPPANSCLAIEEKKYIAEAFKWPPN